jgi:predicted ATPase
MTFLRSVELRAFTKAKTGFPFNLEFVKSFKPLQFTSAVTFLVGENGSGKSTFLEALACAVGSTTVGSESVRTDQTLAPVRELADHLKLVWSKRSSRGFFMRSEDFFGYAKKMAQIKDEMKEDLAEIDSTYQARSEQAKNLARMPYQRELGELQRSYGDGLDSNSHGEAFFKLFRERFTGEGLYLLDEPEAPLSPTRQLTLLAMIKMLIEQKAQFIIATHSPILMAYPNAQILSFDGGSINELDYDSVEQVMITRNFLKNPLFYLKRIMEG